MKKENVNWCILGGAVTGGLVSILLWCLLPRPITPFFKTLKESHFTQYDQVVVTTSTDGGWFHALQSDFLGSLSFGRFYIIGIGIKGDVMGNNTVFREVGIGIRNRSLYPDPPNSETNPYVFYEDSVNIFGGDNTWVSGTLCGYSLLSRNYPPTDFAVDLFMAGFTDVGQTVSVSAKNVEAFIMIEGLI